MRRIAQADRIALWAVLALLPGCAKVERKAASSTVATPPAAGDNQRRSKSGQPTAEQDAAAESMAADDPDPVVFVNDLQLARDPLNEADGRGARYPIVLPGKFARAEFGFFDTKKVLRQLRPARLIEMQRFDFGFRFVADLDRDGSLETYRTGWYRLPGGELGQFLAVFEDRRLRDLWTADAPEPLKISWAYSPPRVFACNCPESSAVVYAGNRLRMTPLG